MSEIELKAANLVTRLRAIDEDAMYQEPATTFATVQEAATVIERARDALINISKLAITLPWGRSKQEPSAAEQIFDIVEAALDAREGG